MGGKSSSSAEETTTATTTNTNQQGNTAPINTAAASGKKSVLSATTGQFAPIVTSGKNSRGNITLSDMGAIEAAGQAVNASIELSNNALDRIERVNSQSILQAQQSSAGVYDFARQSIATIEEAGESEDQQNFNNLLKWAVVAAGLYLVSKAYK